MIDVVGPQRKVNSEFEAGDQNLEEREHLPSAAGKSRVLYPVRCSTWVTEAWY